MSGIFGFSLMKNDISNTRCESILRNMRKALPQHTAVDDDAWMCADGHIGLGSIHAKNVGHPIQFAYDKKNKMVCVLDGYFFSDSQYPDKTTPNKSGAANLLERYLDDGPECVSRISGSFNVAWYDEKKDRLVLATDKIGQRLMFYGSQNGDFAFASYIARIMACGLIPVEIDIESFANLIRISYVPGDGTLFKDIKCMLAGSMLTFEKGQVEIRKYWSIDRIEPHGSYDSKRLDEIEALFKTAVSRSLSSGVDTAIGLTGGIDSRCILAAAANMQLPLLSFTGGQPDSTDVVIAQKTAEITKSKHFFECIGPEKIIDWLFPMALYQGGMVASLHSHPCQHFELSYPFNAYVQGIGPPGYISGQAKYSSFYDILEKKEALAALKKGILKSNLENFGFENIWKKKYKTICSNAFDKCIHLFLENYEVNDDMIAFIDYFELDQECRKFLNKANVIVRNIRENYFPYLDHELISALAELPIKERIAHSIQNDLIRRFFPKLLKVPLANTMRPIDRSLLQDWFKGKYSAVKTTIFGKSKNFHREKPIPNHYMSQWSRQEMREGLVKILFNPKAAFREYLDWKAIEPMLNAHFSGRHNWESVIGALVVFEISHNLWVDEKKPVCN